MGRLARAGSARLVVSGLNRRDERRDRRRARFNEDDPAILTDDNDGASDPGPVRFDRAVRRRDLAALVNEEIEGERQRIAEGAVAGGIGGIHPEWFGVDIPELIDDPANGGELVPSAAGHVLRIENQQGAFGVADLTEANDVVGRPVEREIRRYIANLH